MSLFASAMLIIAVLWTVLVVAGRIARWDSERLKQLDSHARAFFKHVEEVLDDPNVPFRLRKIVVFMVHALDDRRSARRFHGVIARHREIMRNGKSREDPEVREFRERYPDVADAVNKAVMHGFLAISYRSWFWGPLLRSLIAEMATNPRKAAPVAVSIEQEMRGFHFQSPQAA